MKEANGFPPFIVLFKLSTLVHNQAIRLNNGLGLKKIVNNVLMTVFLVLSFAFSILISSPVSHWAVAQMQNTTLPHNTNNTKQIVNLKDRTITLVNTTTNETISVKPIPETTGNMTANETLSGTAANMTANNNLTEKFRELGK
jgi:hypothetical protein